MKTSGTRPDSGGTRTVRTLDFRSIDFVRRTAEFLVVSTRDFLDEHANETVSELGIGMYGVSGSLELYFETPDHAREQVRRYPDYVEKDESGFFNGNPADYKYCQGSLEFAEWRAWYWGIEGKFEEGASRRLVDQYGLLHEFVDEADDPINAVTCECTVAVLRDFCSTPEFAALKKESVFRLGVTPWNSSHARHWQYSGG